MQTNIIKEGNPNCDHQFVVNNLTNRIGRRICRMCGRLEKFKIKSEYEEVYEKFHGKKVNKCK
jgi:hypothetical protein